LQEAARPATMPYAISFYMYHRVSQIIMHPHEDL
jgi:hypothetical protein